MVLCMIGCALVAFIPPAYYAGISTTRHMVGMNLATSLAFVVAAALAVSLIRQALTRPGRRAAAGRRARGPSRWPRSVRDRDDNVGGLDHRDHLAALGQPEFAGRLDGDGGDQPDAVRVQRDVGGGLPDVTPVTLALI